VLFHPIILCVSAALGHLFGGRSLQNEPSDGVLTAQVPDGPVFVVFGWEVILSVRDECQGIQNKLIPKKIMHEFTPHCPHHSW
jgi:hypothetical protein